MPVVGIYTIDFPAYSGTLDDSTIIVVAETGNNVTYRTTIGALRGVLNDTISFTSDSSGEYDFTTYLGGDPLPAIPALKTLYAGNYSQPMGDFNLTTRIMSGLQPSTSYTLVY